MEGLVVLLHGMKMLLMRPHEHELTLRHGLAAAAVHANRLSVTGIKAVNQPLHVRNQ